MSLCTICAAEVRHTYHCAQTHPGLCHWCGSHNGQGALGYYDHADPEASLPPTPVVLAPRDVAALVQYQRHVMRTVGTQELRRMMLEEPS